MSEEILDLIRQLEQRLGARFDAIQGDVASIGARLDAIQSDLGKLRQRFDSQPDMRLLGHNVEIMMERLSELEATSIRGFAALNDIAGESVTPGEVEALHSKVRDLSDARFGHEGRLRRLQRELNIAD